MTISKRNYPRVEEDTPIVAAIVASDENSAPPAPPISLTTTQPNSMVTVIAPSRLSEGYRFRAQVDGIDFEVVVPPGGVEEGQSFQVPYPNSNNRPAATIPPRVIPPTSSSSAVSAPKGRWRVGLCSCCDVCCDALFWMGWCFTPIVLGQLAQRLRLNIWGYPGVHSSSCRTIAVIFAIYLGLLMLGIGAILWPLALVYFVLLGLNVRYNYRQHYEIPTSMACCYSCCDGMLEDFFCSFCCECCMTIQIERHTHDSKDYAYHACTETGLSETAPPIIL